MLHIISLGDTTTYILLFLRQIPLPSCIKYRTSQTAVYGIFVAQVVGIFRHVIFYVIRRQSNKRGNN